MNESASLKADQQIRAMLGDLMVQNILLRAQLDAALAKLEQVSPQSKGE